MSLRGSRIALRTSMLSAAILLVGVAYLTGDYLVFHFQEREAQSRIEEYESRVGTEAAIAERLHAERERITGISLARKARNRVVAWVLLVAGALLVGSVKWYRSRRPQANPELEALVAERFAIPPSNGRRPASRLVSPPPEAAAADEADVAFVDELVERLGRNREAAIPMLQAIQQHYRYLPDEALRRVCRLTEITPAQIAGTSSFYAQFRRSPVGRYVVRVCHGTACHVAGAEQITGELRRHLEIADDQDTDPRRRFTLDAVACVGCCSLAPVMMIEEETAGRLTPASARQVLDSLGADA